jgi:hypothetical protein
VFGPGVPRQENSITTKTNKFIIIIITINNNTRIPGFWDVSLGSFLPMFRTKTMPSFSRVKWSVENGIPQKPLEPWNEGTAFLRSAGHEEVKASMNRH